MKLEILIESPAQYEAIRDAAIKSTAIQLFGRDYVCVDLYFHPAIGRTYAHMTLKAVE